MDVFLAFMDEHGNWVGPLIVVFLLGFGWLVRKALEKPTPPASPLADEAFEALIEKHKGTINDQGETIKALQNAVNALSDQGNAPETSEKTKEGIQEALIFLKQDKTDKAEDIFQRILDEKQAEGQAANLEAAEAAKHLGALAYLHNPKKSLKAYQKASTLNPDDAQAWNRLGHLLKLTGDLAAAEQAYNKVLALGNKTADKGIIAAALGNLGIIARIRGDLDKAVDYQQQAYTLDTELGHKEGMANDLGNLEAVAELKGDIPKACRLWKEALALFEDVGMKPQIKQTQANLASIDCPKD